MMGRIVEDEGGGKVWLQDPTGFSQGEEEGACRAGKAVEIITAEVERQEGASRGA